MANQPAGLRVLGRLRLSVSRDESTSIERQRELIDQWAAMHNHTVVGWAEDVDVSGSVDPFETPSLGPWLNERAPEWDVLCAWKLDRLGRNAIQLSKLFGWCQEHDKTVVSCSESIDLSTWAGRMLASVIAGLAEGELEAIRERARASKQKLRESARWSGGKPPYGYVGVKRPDGPGYMLELDPEAQGVVRRIVDGLMNGTGLTQQAGELNAEGVPTPAQHYAVQRGREPKPGKWAASQLRAMMRSPALRGFAHHNGQTVRDDQGVPISLAEPLVTPDEWEYIQGHLDRIQESRKGIRRIRSPLAGVAHCYFCESPLHHTTNNPERGGTYAYYRCPNKCTVDVPAGQLEEALETSFLEGWGSEPIRERVWVPGDSREAEKREQIAALNELTAMVGTVTSATTKGLLARQIAAVDGRLAELESAPAREARWDYRETGGTYGKAWERAKSPEERRNLLTRSGITVRVGISVDGKRSKWNAGAWHFAIHSEHQRWAAEPAKVKP